MTLFNLVNRYFWLVAIAVAGLNAAILWQRSQRHIRENPALAPGYATLLRGYWICSTLPWVVMGIGIVLGGIPEIVYFLHPRTTNPYVLAWWGTYWLVVGFITHWMLFRGGAEMMIAHPGFVRARSITPKGLKLYWLLALAGSVVFTVVMFSQTPPLPLEISPASFLVH
jgi:hypothetical protein